MNTARANSRSIATHEGHNVFVAKNSTRVALLVKVE
jgi:hypothetical protein